MSIDLNWETLTSGPDGDALAERIRSFIHDKFQTVPLPRFIRSVNVHGFEFGKIPPELELKDITDPLPDFYDQELEAGESDDEFDSDEEAAAAAARQALANDRRKPDKIRTAGLKGDITGHDMGSPFLGTSTPGILGGPGLNYFQSHLGTGTHTPLAAVAGAHLGNNWMGPGFDSSDLHHYHQRHSRNPSQSSISVDNFSVNLDAAAAAAAAAAATLPGAASAPPLREKSSVSTLAPTSVSTSRPPTRDPHVTESAVVEEDEDGGVPPPLGGVDAEDAEDHDHRHRREPRVDDMQAVFRIQYSGDIKLNLTAEILLDYPMPSFVGIPLKLNITGLTFDGVGVFAKIRKRVHFCFLSPEDALAAVGSTDDNNEEKARAEGEGRNKRPAGGRFGGLLQEIKVESEIGEQESGKQSLKNVGKVERFVLEQVRRIFEEEFVYPSFWTFLV